MTANPPLKPPLSRSFHWLHSGTNSQRALCLLNGLFRAFFICNSFDEYGPMPQTNVLFLFFWPLLAERSMLLFSTESAYNSQRFMESQWAQGAMGGVGRVREVMVRSRGRWWWGVEGDDGGDQVSGCSRTCPLCKTSAAPPWATWRQRHTAPPVFAQLWSPPSPPHMPTLLLHRQRWWLVSLGWEAAGGGRVWGGSLRCSSDELQSERATISIRAYFWAIRRSSPAPVLTEWLQARLKQHNN